MKVINVMNFVRFIDERMENSTEVLYNTTRDQLALVTNLELKTPFFYSTTPLTMSAFQGFLRKTPRKRPSLVYGLK